MANGFDYESPLNRLLSVTLPQFVNNERNRQESSRRFDEQMAVEADARRQQQFNFEQQQTLQKEQFAFNKERTEKADDADMDSGLISSLDRITDLGRKEIRINKLMGQVKTTAGKNSLEGMLSGIQNTREIRQADLESLKEIDLINDRELILMTNQINSPGYEKTYNNIVGQAIKQANKQDDRGFIADREELKSIITEIPSLYKVLTETIDEDEKKAIQATISRKEARKLEVLEGMRIGSGQPQSVKGTTFLAGGGRISASVLNSYVTGSEDIPEDLLAVLNEEDFQDLENQRMAYESGVESKLAQQAAENPPLTPKQKALLKRAEQKEAKKLALENQMIDPTGRTTLEGILNMMQNLQAGDNPQTPFNPSGR